MAADASEIVAKVKQFIELVDKYLEKSRTVSYWTGFVDQQLKQGLKPSLIADGNKNRYRRERKDAAADVLTTGQELAGLLTEHQLDFTGVMTVREAVGAHRPETVENIWEREKARLRAMVNVDG